MRKEKELDDFKGFLEEAARWQKVNLLRSSVEGVELTAIKNNSLSEKLTAWLQFSSLGQKKNWTGMVRRLIRRMNCWGMWIRRG
jgi:hypothetical protein